MQKSSHLPRVLTATARGLGHWSKFKAQIPMLFEIIGTLDSAVVAGPLGSREFSVQAGDGALRCLYWEIDTTLPHLVRGKPIRVVGGWDEKQEWLKCHSVREATQDEVQTAGDMVTLCDAAMRETLATTPEM
ncbi:Spermatogenesis-associated protein 22 [Geodia barretti]|uniref:Spermatogenesis-associated protein 22 n=1 Tax=Geodia barretti TaxID=519541 RepID=A0AA35QXS3_GEOBA|nr:Spermatogenesis-associated protein 22 [Geodia barretti]